MPAGIYDRSHLRIPLRARFDAKWIRDEATGCWNWTEALTHSGYGMIQTGVRPKPKCSLAHRVAWILYKEAIPEGIHVLHRCDNPRCVNPDHLFLGTHDDNMADMARKGRSWPKRHPELMPRGSNHGMAVLNESLVAQIKNLLSGGRSMRALAREFNVDRGTISNIRKGKTWRHVTI